MFGTLYIYSGNLWRSEMDNLSLTSQSILHLLGGKGLNIMEFAIVYGTIPKSNPFKIAIDFFYRWITV